MRTRFYGGPYDGREIDGPAIHQYASILPVSGPLGKRIFVLMPPPESWDKLVSGREAETNPKYPYEEKLTQEGDMLVWLPEKGFDQALLESRLRVHSSAAMVLSTFPNEYRKYVITTISNLQRTSPDRWPAQTVRQIGEKPVYLVHLNEEFRAFVRFLDSGELELFHIINEETLRVFQERFSGAGVAQ